MINIFETAYRVWGTRELTPQEMREHYHKTGQFQTEVEGDLLREITNHYEAAEYILECVADNRMEGYIDDYLDSSQDYKALRSAMPSKTPKSISDYQQLYPNYNSDKVIADINEFGCTLPEGTQLFHGGFWPEEKGEVFTLDKPLSTSLCPQVALRNAIWKGKSYDNSSVHLFVLNVVEPKTHVFCLRKNGTKLGHEKEVLFSSGAILKLRKKTLIRPDYCALKIDQGREVKKPVPAYVLEFDIT